MTDSNTPGHHVYVLEMKRTDSGAWRSYTFFTKSARTEFLLDWLDEVDCIKLSEHFEPSMTDVNMDPDEIEATDSLDLFDLDFLDIEEEEDYQ